MWPRRALCSSVPATTTPATDVTPSHAPGRGARSGIGPAHCAALRRALWAIAMWAATAGPVGAQAFTRVGVSFGGISTIGVVIEREDSRSGWELNVGTWAFSDVSVSVVHRWYVGDPEYTLRPTVGLGLWGVAAFSSGARPGAVLVARAPLGIEWRPTERQAVLLDGNLNRALAVRRREENDDTPLSRRFVPLPGVSWRMRSR